jgi:hypothetical protein
VYTINSSIICLFLSTTFLGITYRFFEFTSAYGVYIYGLYVYIPFYNGFYLFNSFIDVFISLERLSIFMPKFKKLNKIPWRKGCIIMFLASMIINFPIFFIFDKAKFSLEINNIEVYKIWSFILSKFALSLKGKVTQFLIYLIRDILTLGLEIILNVLTIVLMKKHFKIKKNVMPSLLENDESSTIQKNISKAEKNLVRMVVIMCLLSILQHIFFITSTTYFSLYQNKTTMYLSYASYQITSIKHSSNFFIFVSFNNLFRHAFKKIFIKNRELSKSTLKESS